MMANVSHHIKKTKQLACHRRLLPQHRAISSQRYFPGGMQNVEAFYRQAWVVMLEGTVDKVELFTTAMRVM